MRKAQVAARIGQYRLGGADKAGYRLSKDGQVLSMLDKRAESAGAAFPSKGFAELRHDHFMAKVPEVLGDEAPKFLGTDFYLNGSGAKVSRAIYIFPKREACLMAMNFLTSITGSQFVSSPYRSFIFFGGVSRKFNVI